MANNNREHDVRLFYQGLEIGKMKTLDTTIKKEDNMLVERGNVIVGKEAAYIVSRIGRKLFLIDLKNGNRWSDEGYDILHDNKTKLSYLTMDELEVCEVFKSLEDYLNNTKYKEEVVKQTIICEKEIQKTLALALTKVNKDDQQYISIKKISKDIYDFLVEKGVI